MAPEVEQGSVDMESVALCPSPSPSWHGEIRQGVFIHSFKCQECTLEFALFSWWLDRHKVGNTACPECHRVTPKVHWVSVLANDPGQRFGKGPEIYEHSPLGPDPRLMRDSSVLAGLD